MQDMMGEKDRPVRRAVDQIFDQGVEQHSRDDGGESPTDHQGS
jgi:hypothetical protein